MPRIENAHNISKTNHGLRKIYHKKSDLKIQYWKEQKDRESLILPS